MIDTCVARRTGGITAQELGTCTEGRVVDWVANGARDRSEVAAVTRLVFRFLTPLPKPDAQGSEQDAERDATDDSTSDGTLVRASMLLAQRSSSRGCF